jgi:hypothetical protein
VTGLWVALAVVLLVVVVGAWFSWTATRLDQLHHRVDLGRESLNTQLALRSGVVLELAGSGVLDDPEAVLLSDAAQRARRTTGTQAESGLSRVLRAVFASPETVATVRAAGTRTWSTSWPRPATRWSWPALPQRPRDVRAGAALAATGALVPPRRARTGADHGGPRRRAARGSRRAPDPVRIGTARAVGWSHGRAAAQHHPPDHRDRHLAGQAEAWPRCSRAA